MAVRRYKISFPEAPNLPILRREINGHPSIQPKKVDASLGLSYQKGQVWVHIETLTALGEAALSHVIKTHKPLSLEDLRNKYLGQLEEKLVLLKRRIATGGTLKLRLNKAVTETDILEVVKDLSKWDH